MRIQVTPHGAVPASASPRNRAASAQQEPCRGVSSRHVMVQVVRRARARPRAAACRRNPCQGRLPRAPDLPTGLPPAGVVRPESRASRHASADGALRAVLPGRRAAALAWRARDRRRPQAGRAAPAVPGAPDGAGPDGNCGAASASASAAMRRSADRGEVVLALGPSAPREGICASGVVAQQLQGRLRELLGQSMARPVVDPSVRWIETAPWASAACNQPRGR